MECGAEAFAIERLVITVYIEAILACYDRRNLTLTALAELTTAANRAHASLGITLFDDGSSDGTAESVKLAFPSSRILTGDGNAYWARGMAVAEAAVLEKEATRDDVYILWLNDDVNLDDDSFERISATLAANPGQIIVGAMRDPVTGSITYSGLRRRGLHPLSYRPVAPSERSEFVETLNGNFVLVPIEVAKALKGIDGQFSHAWADVDYGLRARALGVNVIMAPGTYGTCSTNPPLRQISLIADWRRHLGIKGGGNYRSLKRLLQRHYPGSWPVVIAASYSKWWLSALLMRVARKN